MGSNRRLHSTATSLVVLALFASMLALATGTGPAGSTEAPPVFVTSWGTNGTGQGEFAFPMGTAVDGDGNVYVVDQGNDRIQRFDADGTFVTQWGTTGSATGQFNDPIGVAVDGDGNVYVTEYSGHRIQKFTAAGVFLTTWSGFSSPTGVATDGDGNVYVADHGSDRVQKFTATGTLLASWGGYGTGDGQFVDPNGLVVDGSGNLYIADGDNHRIEQLDPAGAFVRSWGGNGNADGQFNFPYGIALDTDGNVYVTDGNNNRMQEFTSTGTHLATWGSYGSADGQVRYPYGIAVSEDGQIYVADTDNHRVQVFAPPAPPAPQPDARIKKGTGAFVGNDVYNTTGLGQTRTGVAPRGSSVTYTIKVQNDALVADTLRLKGAASNTRFKVTYTAGGADITPAIVAGTYTTPELAPGATFTVRVVVKVKSTAPAGASLTGALTAKSNTDTTYKDTVKFVTRRA